MRIRVLSSLFLLAASFPSRGATVEIRAGEGPLAIDGRIEEEVWQEAAVLPPGGELRALVRGGYLCLSARMPESGRVVARSTGTNPTWWREDLVTWSFRFRSVQGRNVLLTLAVNPLGAYRLETTGAQGTVMAAASIASGAWAVEAAIPVSMLADTGFLWAERVRPPRPDAPETRWTWPAPNDRLDFRLSPGSSGVAAPVYKSREQKEARSSAPPASIPYRVWTDEERKTLGIAEMVHKSLRTRVTAAVTAEKKEWEKVGSLADWEKFRDGRLAALRDSFGPFPGRTPLRAEVTRRLDYGEGFVVENVIYESRPGLVVTANLYLPAKPAGRIPAIVVVHSHHAPRFQSELQDMGMTWARAGTAVLVMDQLGAGERVQSQAWPRESYFSRYAMGMQLLLAGESLMKWMVWDLMRGIDMLLERPYVDPTRIVMLGAVAGGGDPAAVTAALDERIAAVIPFNFGEAGPEEHYTEGPRPYSPEFADPGWGSWETTRNLGQSISGQFFPWFICASVAPRRFVYALEIGWPGGVGKEPAWKRYTKVFSLFGKTEHLAEVDGFGPFPGPGECTNVGVYLRKKIYPILSRWLKIEAPGEEYHNTRPEAELAALTPRAAVARQPKTASELAMKLAEQRLGAARARLASLSAAERRPRLRESLAGRLGNIEPRMAAPARLVWSKEVDGRRVEAVALETEPGIQAPLLLIKPGTVSGRLPVVIGLAQGGKEGFLRHRSTEVEALLKAGAAVCLADVRGAGEAAWSANRGPGGMSLAATELMLGETMLGAQLKDARAIYRYVAGRSDIDGKRIAVWGDSFGEVNPQEMLLDQSAGQQPGPWPIEQAEPMGGLLAMLTALYEDGVKAVAARRCLVSYLSVLGDRFTYVPLDAIVPGLLGVGDVADMVASIAPRPVLLEDSVDGRNRAVKEEKRPAPVAGWLAEQLSR